MTQTHPVHRVAIVGPGTIGASWATHYLARGFDVVATDPAPGAEDRLRSYVDAAWEAAQSLGRSAGASADRLQFVADLRKAVADADFVQENGPERLDLKVQMFADIDDATSDDVLIASSSSGITMSEIQSECRHPERTFIGHPFRALLLRVRRDQGGVDVDDGGAAASTPWSGARSPASAQALARPVARAA